MQTVDQELETYDPELDALEADEFKSEAEFEQTYESEFENAFSEDEIDALAAELLEITDEEELDLFLGKLFKKAWKGIKKVGRKVVRPLGRVVKGMAKKALPVLGGALGSFIPVPGVGTAVGTALGSALSRTFEMEFEGMDADQQEFEMARRFVKVAGATARKAALAPPTADPIAAVKAAALSAMKKQSQGDASKLGSRIQSGMGSKRAGRWERRGRTIVLYGA
jgi:uncharacterized protein (DUF697 family)